MFKKIMPFALSFMLTLNSFGSKVNAGEFKIIEQNNPIYRMQIPKDLTKKDLRNNVKLGFNGRDIYFRRNPKNDYLEFKLFDPHSVNKKGVLSFSIENHRKYDDQTIRKNFGRLYQNYADQPLVKLDNRQPAVGFLISYDGIWSTFKTALGRTEKTLSPEIVRESIVETIEKYNIEKVISFASNSGDRTHKVNLNKPLYRQMSGKVANQIIDESIIQMMSELNKYNKEGKLKKHKIICIVPAFEISTKKALYKNYDYKNTDINLIEIIPEPNYPVSENAWINIKNSKKYNYYKVYTKEELKNTLEKILETDGFRYDYNKNQIEVFNKK